MYYAAYGSNLNMDQMKLRCPTAKVVGHAYLKDYKLLFRVYATVEITKGSKVPIAIWEINNDDERRLDGYEGYPRLYRKEIVSVNVGDSNYDVMLYVMNEDVRAYELPNSYYLGVVLQGYNDMGFEYSYLKEALMDTKNLLSDHSLTE